jgi:hypothetical protein
MCPPPHLAAPASPELAQSDRDAQPSVAQERERLRPQRRGLQRGWAVGRSPHDKGPGSEDEVMRRLAARSRGEAVVTSPPTSRNDTASQVFPKRDIQSSSST